MKCLKLSTVFFINLSIMKLLQLQVVHFPLSIVLAVFHAVFIGNIIFLIETRQSVLLFSLILKLFLRMLLILQVVKIHYYCIVIYCQFYLLVI